MIVNPNPLQSVKEIDGDLEERERDFPNYSYLTEWYTMYRSLEKNCVERKKRAINFLVRTTIFPRYFREGRNKSYLWKLWLIVRVRMEHLMYRFIRRPSGAWRLESVIQIATRISDWTARGSRFCRSPRPSSLAHTFVHTAASFIHDGAFIHPHPPIDVHASDRSRVRRRASDVVVVSFFEPNTWPAVGLEIAT